MKIEDMLKENISLPNISLDKCIYKKKLRTAHFVFFADDAVEDKTAQQAAALLKEKMGAGFVVTAEFLKPPKNPEAVKAAVREYIKGFLPLYSTLQEEDIVVDRVEDGDITVYLTVRAALKSFAVSISFQEKCSEYLTSRYHTPSHLILRVEREVERDEEAKKFLSAQNDFQKVRPQKVEGMRQQNLFGEDFSVPKYLLDNSFVVFDFETTGLDGMIDKIVEIGAVKISGGVVTEKFSTLINPLIPIPKESTKTHTITDEMVKYAPTIAEVIPDFLRFAENCPLIAHNADFDSKFLRTVIEDLGIQAEFEFIDTLQLAREHLPNLSNHKLKTLAAYFGTGNSPDHRALADAMATAEVFIELVKGKEKY